MKAAILLAMLPLGVLGLVWVRPAPAPVVPVAVTTEGVRRVDMDTRTFRARWIPVSDMPTPVSIIREPQSVEDAPLPKPGAVVYVGTPNKCTRRGLRKVMVGKLWRCRRA